MTKLLRFTESPCGASSCADQLSIDNIGVLRMATEPKALPITKFAAAYGVHPSTVWRGLKEGRLRYVVVGKRKLVLLPVARKEEAQGVKAQSL
jgi:hypothetical protein